VANQTHYLRQSKCFQKSDDLTCITCHNPHRPKSPAATAAVEDSCLKCHAPAACGEHARLPAAVRGDCTGCHMPKGIKINVHFHTEDDEYVAPILRSQHRIGGCVNFAWTAGPMTQVWSRLTARPWTTSETTSCECSPRRRRCSASSAG
jgi:hypothetical protein